MLSRLGIEGPALQYAVAFAIILILVALFGLVLRRLTGGRLMLPGQDRARARQPRLGVVDVYDLDRQRQLILLRRDNVEHLLLIGGPNDVVIETNIVRMAGSRMPAAVSEPALERSEPVFDRVAEGPSGRPLAEPPGRPGLEAPVAARLGPVGAARAGEGPQPDQDFAPVASTTAQPSSARVEPMLKPDAVNLAPMPRPARPEPSPVPPPKSAPPSPAPPPPAPEQRPATPPAARSPAPGSHPEAAVREGKARDAAVLSDMAKQLEEALRRPQPPTAGSGERPSSTPMREPPPRRPAPPVEPAPPPPPPRAPEPSAGSPSRTQPTPAPRPAPAPRDAKDPFSVEDIEAEFARLLGRPNDKGQRGS